MAVREKKKFNVVDAMSMIVNGDNSDLSELSSDEEDNDEGDLYQPKRRSLEVSESKLGRKPVTPSPHDAVRTDQYGHWPVFRNKGRGRKCKTGYSRVYCSKCNICLCLTSQRNCFLEFHDEL